MKRERFCCVLFVIVLLLPACVKIQTEGRGMINPRTPSLFRKVEAVAILPFSYYSSRVTTYERMRGEVPELVADAVTNHLLLKGVRVADRGEVNVRLTKMGIIHPLEGDQELLPATLPYEITNYRRSQPFKKAVESGLEELEARSGRVKNNDFPDTAKITREDMVRLSYALKTDLIIRGRIVEHSGAGRENAAFPYSFIPGAVGNMTGVAYLPNYDHRLAPSPAEDIKLIKKKSIWDGLSVSEYSGIALRLYAFDGGNGAPLWSNGTVITYQTFTDPPIDVERERDRLRRLVDEKVSLLVDDLLK